MYFVIRPLCAVDAGIYWFFPDGQLIGAERKYLMLKLTLSYVRYTLSALASIGFQLTNN
jgi:hypothetical protein